MRWAHRVHLAAPTKGPPRKGRAFSVGSGPSGRPSRPDACGNKGEFGIFETKVLIRSHNRAVCRVKMAESAMKWGDHRDELARSLQEKEELIASITANLPGAVYQFYAEDSGKWGMHLVADKAEEIFGISSEPETFVQQFIAHLHDDCRSDFISSVNRAVTREEAWSFEGRFIRPDGREIYFQASSTPKRKGTQLVFDGILLDVSERHQAKLQKEAQEQFLRALTNNLPGVVYEFRVDEVGNLGVTYVSEKAREIFGISPDPVGFIERFMAGIPEGDRDRAFKSVMESVRAEVPWHYQGSFERPDGSVVFFRGDAVPTRRAGLLLFHGILLDLTEHRRVEEELRHAQKLDSIGQLAGGVAHDFNNMLAGIVGAAELLQQRLTHDQQGVALTQMILDTSARAGELTWQLLAFSRKAVRVRKPLLVHEQIERTVKILERSIDRRITIEMDLVASQHTVKGDPGQLQAAFLNLGVNARDAMPEGGVLRFETAVVSVLDHDETTGLALRPGAYLRIRVSDTGTGIPADVRARVFEPFFTTKPIGEGTGMGLAAVYGTAMEHQGSVSILETSERGTYFQMLLPLIDQGDPKSLPPSAKPLRMVSGRVLLIDDETIVRKTASELLRSLGYEVLDFGDPRAAIDHFESCAGEYDLVVLDMVMPRLNGEEVFRMLRTIRGDVPVVLCSGYALDESVVRLRREGLAGHLKKPFRREELREALESALEAARIA